MSLRVALFRSMVINGQRLNAETARAIASAAGGGDIRTAGSTGNVVFASRKAVATLTREMEAACEAHYGKATEIIVKTGEEWRRLVATNPFPEEAERTPNRVLVWAMRSPVPDSGLAQLRRRAARSEKIERTPDGDFYIWLGRRDRDATKLAAGFGLNNLGAVGTNRTWTTIQRISALVGA